jgi:hypothetical protein
MSGSYKDIFGCIAFRDDPEYIAFRDRVLIASGIAVIDRSTPEYIERHASKYVQAHDTRFYSAPSRTGSLKAMEIYKDRYTNVDIGQVTSYDR